MKSFAFLLFFVPVLFSVRSEIRNTHTESYCLTEEEQRLYAMIMDYRKNMKLPAIPISAKLTAVAKEHTKDLMEHYTFDVENSCNPHSWSKSRKWTACCYTSDHKQAQCMWNKPKEIADYAGNGYEIAYYTSGDAGAFEALDGWKKSPGHNPLLVNSGIWAKVKWNAIGISLYKNYGTVWFGELADTTQIQNCN